MKDLKTTPTIEIITKLDEIQNQIYQLADVYETYKDELVNRMPPIAESPAFDLVLKRKDDEDVKVYKM